MDVFTVSAMTEADLDEVVAIEAVSHPKAKGRESFESDLKNDVARCLVLRGEDRVVGYMVVWVTDVVEVIDIAIAPELRGRRLAERLLARALRLGPTVLLEVRASNAAAMRLYERFGFARVGLRRGYYADGEDAVLMSRAVKVAGEVEASEDRLRVRRERAAWVRGLYPILSDDVLDVGDFAAAAAVIAPRVSVMQLRFKDSPDAVALRVAREVVARLAGWSGLLVINDRADLLRLLDVSRETDLAAPQGGHGGLPLHGDGQAYRSVGREGHHGGGRGVGPFLGLHLGQTDLPVGVARPLMSIDAVLGFSTHELGQLSEALLLPEAVAPDYLAYGPVFATGTKKNPDPVVGLEGLAAARSRLDELAAPGERPPLVAIGGLDPERAALALQYADAVAVIGALFGGGLAELERRLETFSTLNTLNTLNLGRGARA